MALLQTTASGHENQNLTTKNQDKYPTEINNSQFECNTKYNMLVITIPFQKVHQATIKITHYNKGKPQSFNSVANYRF